MENQTQLTVADLGNLKQLIDIACERGAFRAAEMRSVGETYDRLTAFLVSITRQSDSGAVEESNPQGGESND
jgi:hypothetical protein